jgi:predicted transcriptional regulator
MMFFGKKKHTGAVPIERIKQMQQKGMSDKDIIKTLKDDGYDYDEIEKGMLQSVKEGVSQTTDFDNRYDSTASEPLPKPAPEPAVAEGALPTAEDIMKPVPEEHAIKRGEELPETRFEDSDLSPELVIEELVEGVIDEKWEKIQKKLKFMDEEMERVRMAIHQIKKRPASEATPDINLDEVYDKIDDLDARIGGLEKAFKQFLPSLTRNIENLSRIIDDMKKK